MMTFRNFSVTLVAILTLSIVPKISIAQVFYITAGYNGFSAEENCNSNLKTTTIRVYGMYQNTSGKNVLITPFYRNADSSVHQSEDFIIPGTITHEWRTMPVKVALTGPGDYAVDAWFRFATDIDTTESEHYSWFNSSYGIHYDPSNCVTVRGKAYSDLNDNCTFDSGDSLMGNFQIPNSNWKTDSSGNYTGYYRIGDPVSVIMERYVKTGKGYYLTPSCLNDNIAFYINQDTIIDFSYKDSIHSPAFTINSNWNHINPVCYGTEYVGEFSLSGAPPLPRFTLSLNFGDGGLLTFENLTYVSTSHTYTGPGKYNAQFQVILEDTTVTFQYVADIPETCGAVRGRVYRDYNENCLFDNELDLVLTNHLFVIATNKVSGEKYYSAVDSAGYYYLQLLDGVEYKIETSANGYEGSHGYFNGLVSCNPFYIINTLQDSLDFAFKCTSSNKDFEVSSWSSRYRPGQVGSTLLYVINKSCDEQSGTLKFTLADNETYSSAFPAPSRIDGKNLEWDFFPIGGANEFFATVYMKLDTNAILGELVCHPVSVTPISGDANPANNSINACYTITGAYDPNDKTSYLWNGKEVSDILETDTSFVFRIRFQNTGTDTAFNIYVLDTINTNMELNSFRILHSSHPVKTYIGKDRQIRFQFDNILLPDDKIDEPGSHGEILYTIRRKSGLSLGTQLKNTAHIYFDYNDAVITNTTVNTIVSPTRINESQGKSDFKIYPNPTSGILNIELNDRSSDCKYSIRDVLGKILHSGPIQSKESISVGNFNPGFYFVTIEGSAIRSTQKILVNGNK